jgi:hypothetical protein
MPVSVASVEAALFTIAPAAVVAVAEPTMALDILPVSAGFSGSIVAGLKTHLGGGGGRWQWLPTVISGACTSVFAGPALAELFGWQSLRLLILMHFLVGLLGSAICDEVLSRARAISRRLVDKADPTKPKG